MCDRCSCPVRAPSLFTGVMAGSEMPISHPLRSSTRTGRCACTPSQPSPACQHDRSQARTRAPRRSMFFQYCEKYLPGEFSGSCMVYKVIQVIASTRHAVVERHRSSGRWAAHRRKCTAGAAQPAPMAPWTDGVLGFVWFECVCVVVALAL